MKKKVAISKGETADTLQKSSKPYMSTILSQVAAPFGFEPSQATMQSHLAAMGGSTD